MVFVLQSPEDGLGMVIDKGYARSCSVIARRHTGAEDLFDDGVEGFILPIRDSAGLADAMQKIADSKGSMREKARHKIEHLGGWNRYGERMREVVTELRGFK